jgi:enoyl-CoA hydratase/carnithine racemase
MSVPIEVTRRDGWAVIRITREAKRNSMNRETRKALRDAFDSLAGVARAIVLTGTGVAFCAGLDLKERESERLAGLPDTAGEEWIALNVAIRAHPAIFIAAVNGLALGGGATLINVCDLAIASTEASIGCPEMGFSMYPGMAGPTSQLMLPKKRAAWLVLTTNRIDGATAEKWGMVNEVVEPGNLLPRAEALAAQIAKFDPVALAEAKKALDQVPANITGWREAMDYGQTVNATIRSKTDATREGLARFAAGKRNPGQGA